MTELHFGAPVEFTHRHAIEQVLAHLVWSDSGLQQIAVSAWSLVRTGDDCYRLNPAGALRAARDDRRKLDALVADSYATSPSPPVLVQFAVSDPQDLVAQRRVRRDTPLSALIADGHRLYVQVPQREDLTIAVDQSWAKELASRPTMPLLPHLHSPRWTLDWPGRYMDMQLARLETGLLWQTKLEAGTHPLGQQGQPLTLAEFGRMQDIIEACYLRWLEDGVEHLQFFGQDTIPVRRAREYLLARYPTLDHWMRNALVPSISVADVSALWQGTAALPPKKSGVPGTRCSLRRKGPPITSACKSLSPVILTLALAIQDGILLHIFPRARDLPRREFYGMQTLLRADGLVSGLLTLAADRRCSEVAAVRKGSANT